MKNLIYIGLILLLTSCMASRKKKSADYYFKNEKSITDILKLYEELYSTQPFSLGFSDRSYKYVGMDIKTDTVRYAMEIEESEKAFFYAIGAFKYDTVDLRRLFVKMKEIKCIWLGKDNLFYKGREETVVFLSFRSVALGNPFLDRKYFMLMFFNPGFINSETTMEIEKHGYKKVNDHIYYTIAEAFR
jgi:hypothetical protein